MQHQILCVDDEVDNVDALERLLRKKYSVIKATSGEAALQLLRSHAPTVIISDQRMPGMTGVEFLSESIKTHPHTARILLTGYTDIESVIAAINSGQIYRYITKPWDPVDLVNTVDKAVERVELGVQLQTKNSELAAALAELQVLDQAKNQFMILINHELKTPLTGIHSYLQLMGETKLSAEQKKFVKRMEEATFRLQKMIDEVLLLINASVGLTKFEAKTFDPQMSIESSIEKLAELAKKKDKSIQLRIGKQKVHWDERLFGDILSRLLQNALRFGSPGTPVHISVEPQDQQSILFCVRNQGEKISSDKIPQILKPFTLNENIMRHSEGLGLGLSICQALLKLGGSHLDIQSSQDEFSVRFKLPDASGI